MAAKNVTQVLIGGRIYTLSGFESEDYLQRVAAYLNNKITEVSSVSSYQRMTPDTRNLMVNLNLADDYFHLKRQADQLNDQVAQKDRELYEIKHELIQTQMKLETAQNSLDSLQEAHSESQKRIVELETRLSAAKS